MKAINVFKTLSIRNKLLFSFIAAFIPLAVLGTLIVYTQVKKSISVNIESELNNSTASISNMVRTAATVSIKNRLRAIAEKNRDIAMHFYRKVERKELTQAEAVRQIREIFLSQTIGKTGYIYCIDSQGTAVLHPRKGVEGKNFDHFGFIQDQIRKKQGYIEYDWKNPGEPEPRPKALYMSYFGPLDWIISVSTYREEFHELIDVEDFRSSVASLQFGKSGYPYVTDIEGNVIIHPWLEGVNLLKQREYPVDFFREMIARKSGKIIYDWKNPEEPQTREKLVIFNYLPEYNWIVASSSYTEEIFAPLNHIRNLIILALCAALLVASSLTFLISGSITKPLHDLMRKFSLGAGGDFSTRMVHQAQDELGQLADYYNSFMDQLTEYSTKLKSEIQERRQAANALKESEERYRRLYQESRRNEELYRSILNTSPDAIVFYDLEGKVRFMSPSFTQIFGWTFEELQGKRIPFVPEEEVAPSQKIIKALIEDGVPCTGFETKRYTKDGRIIDVSIGGARYHDHQGNSAGMLSILRDISETKYLEAQIQHSQRMESIGTLAGGIAHDFNNLLMGIQGRTSLVMAELEYQHPHAEHLRGIEEYVKAATHLTSQLLGFARGGKYEVKPTDINAIVRKTAELFGRTRKELAIQQALQEDIWTVEVDQSQIEQVLLNLFVNSWQAMPDGGRLNLSTRNVELPADMAAAHNLPPGRYVKLQVADTGIGMDDAVQRKIFDPFFTTKERSRGTGLGLSSAYGIVTNHGGAITVQSQVGQGTTFNIYLPASTQKVIASHEDAAKFVRGSGTVLLVDDESIILDVGRRLLEKIGYEVLTAANGAEALALFRHHQARIDLVILDMIMPGMAGDKTFEQLREIDPSVTVLLSSGYSIDGQASSIINRGCNGFIQKPFDMKQLSQKINALLAH